jgi:hypothetical protein
MGCYNLTITNKNSGTFESASYEKIINPLNTKALSIFLSK